MRRKSSIFETAQVFAALALAGVFVLFLVNT